MNMDHLRRYADLNRTDIDLEEFSTALALQYMSRLIANGGSEIRRPDLDPPIDLPRLRGFLARAVETARRTKRFEREWDRLYQLIPFLDLAREKGLELFQRDLTRAMANEEEMEYLSEIDFTIECYTRVAAFNAYPHQAALQAWVTRGYILAWQRLFLKEEDADHDKAATRPLT